MIKQILKYAFYFLIFVTIGTIAGLVIFERINSKKTVETSVFVNNETGRAGGVLNEKVSSLTTIPSLEGIDITDAKLALQELGIEIEKITWVHSDTIEKNRVVAQRPLPGTSEEGKINLLVSSGPYDVSYRCPSFIRMSLEEARRLADTLGLKLIEKGDADIVTSQEPEAGTIVKKGDSVEITLSK